jgi:hypothetical protein
MSDFEVCDVMMLLCISAVLWQDCLCCVGLCAGTKQNSADGWQTVQCVMWHMECVRNDLQGKMLYANIRVLQGVG